MLMFLLLLSVGLLAIQVQKYNALGSHGLKAGAQAQIYAVKI